MHKVRSPQTRNRHKNKTYLQVKSTRSKIVSAIGLTTLQIPRQSRQM